MAKRLTVTLLAVFCACSKKPEAPFPERAGRTVDAAGVRLFLDCRGEGRPTILFESGLGLDGSVWNRAQSDLARTMRACSYDRAGLGRSGPPRPPHAPPQMADELWAALESAGQKGPYVVVGHSMGAAIARWFQRQHEQAVVGMVLLDPVTEEWEARVLADIPLEQQREFWANVGKLEGLERDSLLSSYSALARSGQVLGSVPLLVMTAERDAKDFAMRRDMHAKLSPLSANSLHWVARNTGHVIPVDRPDLVVAAVRAVVSAARTHEKLAPAQAPD